MVRAYIVLEPSGVLWLTTHREVAHIWQHWDFYFFKNVFWELYYQVMLEHLHSNFKKKLYILVYIVAGFHMGFSSIFSFV